MRRLLLLLAVTALAACGSDDTPLDTGDGTRDGSAPAPGTANEPTGEFRSVEVTENGEPRPLVVDTVIALRLEDGRLGASAGCNQLGGDYAIEGGTLVVGDGLAMTEMGCDPPRHEQDEWLADLLTGRPTLTVTGDGFTLASADGATLVRFVERSVVEPDVDLVGTDWEVTGFIDGDAAMSGNVPKSGVLQFTEDGFVGGFDGCNQLGYDPAGDGLRYEVDGDTITFSGNALSTLVACDDTEDYQRRYGAVLSGTVTWEITASSLTLIGADGLGVTYRAVER